MAPGPEHYRPHEAEKSLPESGQLPRGFRAQEPTIEQHAQGERTGELAHHPPRVTGEIFDAGTQPDNVPSEEALTAAGFVFQGVLPVSEIPSLSEKTGHIGGEGNQSSEPEASSEEPGSPVSGELQEGVPQEFPHAPESETPEQRRRRLRNEARYRWNKRHPEKHREEVIQWQKSPKGREYKREYMRQWRQNKKKQQDNEDT